MAEPTNILEWFLMVGLPWATTLILITFLFGTLLYAFSTLFNIEEKSDYTGSHFWLRSFLLAIVSWLIIIFIEFVFILLLFSLNRRIECHVKGNNVKIYKQRNMHERYTCLIFYHLTLYHSLVLFSTHL